MFQLSLERNQAIRFGCSMPFDTANAEDGRIVFRIADTGRSGTPPSAADGSSPATDCDSVNTDSKGVEP